MGRRHNVTGHPPRLLIWRLDRLTACIHCEMFRRSGRRKEATSIDRSWSATLTGILRASCGLSSQPVVADLAELRLPPLDVLVHI